MAFFLKPYAYIAVGPWHLSQNVDIFDIPLPIWELKTRPTSLRKPFVFQTCTHLLCTKRNKSTKNSQLRKHSCLLGVLYTKFTLVKTCVHVTTQSCYPQFLCTHMHLILAIDVRVSAIRGPRSIEHSTTSWKQIRTILYQVICASVAHFNVTFYWLRNSE
jgi:hypothetical protein